eukprot:scaffold20066_cov84-Amphora_coffeaeformis.AAC.1
MINVNGWTPFLEACRFAGQNGGHLDILYFLIQKGASLQERTGLADENGMLHMDIAREFLRRSQRIGTLY